MPGTLTVGERIVLHLSQYTKFMDAYEAPIDISQDGIAAALRISRAHAALELKKLKEAKEVSERLSHIKRGKTKRKVYFLTRQGDDRAKNINKFAEDNSIDLSQYQDIRKCKGPELWKTLDEKHKPVVSMSCIFRKPFKRDILPEISVSLLPVDQNGMVDLPKELKDYVMSITDPEKLRDYHSFAADYWMHWDDTREVLYHLSGARRFVDAEIIVCNSMKELLLQADEDLVDIISNIRDTTKGYSGLVHYAQAEVARRVGRQEYCLILTKGMEASSIPSERFDGYMIEGKLHMDRKEYQLAYRSFIRARGVYDDRLHMELELNIADSLIKSEDYHEAQEILFSLISKGFEDPDDEARSYFLLATIAIKTENEDDAYRLFQKSRRASKQKESMLFNKLSQVYQSMGMRDQALDYALKSANIKVSGSV